MSVDRLGLRGVIGRFYNRLDAVTSAGWQDLIAWRSPSNQKTEEYAWLGATPVVREWIGGRQAQALREAGISITNKRFESTIGLDVDERRRDKSGQAAIRIGEMAERVAEHWSQLLTALLVADPLCYDGQNFFDTDHSEGESGTQVNELSATQISTLAITAAASPTPIEMASAITNVVQYMLAYKDDRGQPMNANAREWAVMVPPNMWSAAEQATQLPIILSGGAAINNLLTNVSMSFRVIVNPRLTDDDLFYVMRTDASGKPFIMQEELFETSTKDESFDQNRILFGVKALRNVGTAYWQYCANVQLSTAA